MTQSPEFVVALCLAICWVLDTPGSFELGDRPVPGQSLVVLRPELKSSCMLQ